MSKVVSETRQAGVSRAFAVAFSVMVAVALLMAAAGATSAASAPAAPVIVNPSEGHHDASGYVSLSGTAPTNSVVKVFEVLADGRESYRGTAEVDATGKWRWTLTGVAQGEHAYVARATDLGSSLVSDWSNTRTVVITAPVLRAPTSWSNPW